MGARADIYYEDLDKKEKEKQEKAYWGYDENRDRQIAVEILEQLDAIFLDQLFEEKNNKWFQCEDMITALLKERYNNGK
jgi:hypothetical protein